MIFFADERNGVKDSVAVLISFNILDFTTTPCLVLELTLYQWHLFVGEFSTFTAVYATHNFFFVHQVLNIGR